MANNFDYEVNDEPPGSVLTDYESRWEKNDDAPMFSYKLNGDISFTWWVPIGQPRTIEVRLYHHTFAGVAKATRFTEVDKIVDGKKLAYHWATMMADRYVFVLQYYDMNTISQDRRRIRCLLDQPGAPNLIRIDQLYEHFMDRHSGEWVKNPDKN